MAQVCTGFPGMLPPAEIEQLMQELRVAPFESYGRLTFTEALRQQERKLVTLWVIDRKRDGLELLGGFLDTLANDERVEVHVVRNLYWGEYARLKIEGEDAYLRSGVPATVVRPTHIYVRPVMDLLGNPQVPVRATPAFVPRPSRAGRWRFPVRTRPRV